MSILYGIFSWLLGSSDTNISVCAFFIKWMCKIFFIRMTDRLWTEVALAIAFEVNELKQSKDYFTLEHIFGKRIAKVAITKACWNDDEINFIWVVIVKRRLFKRKMLRTQSDKCAYEFVEITLRWERSWGQITEYWACLNYKCVQTYTFTDVFGFLHANDVIVEDDKCGGKL